MQTKRKYILAITVAAVILLLGLLNLITGEFVFSACLHTFMRALCVLAIILVIRKCVMAQVPHSINKMSALCGGVLVLDLVVADGVRFILSHGVSTVLLLPPCLPLTFMIVMHYTFKYTENEKRGRALSFLVGIPLLLLSLYFEVLSFTDVL